MILFAAVTTASAQKAPPGMAPYDHPVYHNGKRVLWHGVGKQDASDDQGAASSRHPRSIRRQPSQLAKEAAAPVKPTVEVSIFSDGDDTCAFRIAGDIVMTLKAAGLRARPTVGRTSAHFLSKLIASDAADFVVAPVDALVEDSGAPWKDKAPYVTRLAVERIEIVAGKAIAKVADLENRKVSVGISESADEAVATALFARLGVKPTFVRESLSDSLADLAAAKVDAMVATGENGSKALGDFGKDGRFHLLPAPMTPKLAPFYSPMRISAEDRPNLVAAGDKVDTLAAPMALIAIDAAPGSPRAARDAPFVAALFDKFGALVSSATDPSWRDVNIAAPLAWPRLAAAQDWITQRQAVADTAFDNFRSLARVASQSDGGPKEPDAAALFESLMQARGSTP